MIGELVYVARDGKGYTVYESLPDCFTEFARVYSIERDGVHTIILDSIENRTGGLIRDVRDSIVGNTIGEVQLEKKLREAAINSGIQRAKSRNADLLIGSLEGVHQLSKLIVENHREKFRVDSERLPKYYQTPEQRY